MTSSTQLNSIIYNFQEYRRFPYLINRKEHCGSENIDLERNIFI
jgi:hypothetical protein